MNGNDARPAARPAAIVHPASHLLGQAHLLLRAAHATQAGTYRRGRPPRLDEAQRGRLATLFAAITGLAELQASPSNLPTGHWPDPNLYGWMDHATIRLHQARANLETLTILAQPGPAHSVLTAVADAAQAMDSAWALTQEVGGYRDLRQVDRISAQLGHVVGSLADIAAGEQQQERRWKPAAGLLSTTTHALHYIHTSVRDLP